MKNGPRNPERLPTELTTAMPAAAAAPLKIAVGRHQNCEIVTITHEVTTVRAITAMTMSWLKPTANSHAIAPTHAGTVMCQRRSRMASDERLTRIIAITAAAYGSMLRKPTTRGSLTPEFLMRVGRKKPTP